LLTFVVTQNHVSIVLCSFKEVNGRFASALDLIVISAPCRE